MVSTEILFNAICVFIWCFSETETFSTEIKHSLLTELFQDSRVVVVYYLCATLTFGCIINSILQYLLTDIG